LEEIKNQNKSLVKPLMGGGVGLLVLALPFLIGSILTQYWVFVLCTMLVYIIAVSGLDILFGYSGQISLGHAAFFAIGAYTVALMKKYLGGYMPNEWTLFLFILATMILAAVLSAAIGALLAYPAAKLKFHFLSLATIAFGEVVYNLVNVSPGRITGDNTGMVITGIQFLNKNPLPKYTLWYYFLLFFVGIALLGKHFLVRSRTGRAFTAIRENTHAADGMGINVRKHKIIAFAVSAFYTGLAGALFVNLQQGITPEASKQRQSVLFLTMLLFGGSGSMVGPIIGVAVIEILMELIRPLKEYQMLLYGVLLLIVIVALPGGIYSGIKDAIISLKRRKLVKSNAATKQESKEGDGYAGNK
jgi:branched-chain amino acid transport system permease protein